MEPDQTGQNPDLPTISDPNVVEKIVEELKSQGIFDQIRNDCLAEVDTKPAYQNLRQRVESSVSRFLSKQGSWKPSTNKNQLRNQLRKHIQQSSYLDAGVEGIVDQVVGPKIMPFIEPEVESIMYKMFGVEKPTEEEEQNGNSSRVQRGDLVESNAGPSNLASDEDVEMKSADNEATSGGEEGQGQPSDTSSPGPGLRGDMSPLTPDRSEGSATPARPKPDTTPPPPGTMPLPPRPPTPRTPPLPPPPKIESGLSEESQVEEEVVSQQQECMSSVSDVDLGDISPPKASPVTPEDSGMPSPPPPPPLPDQLTSPPLPLPPPPPPKISSSSAAAMRPPSPLTSPINSSASSAEEEAGDEGGRRREGAAGSVSDISDVELPSSGKESSDDLEELEKARAELQAKLAAANIGDEDDSTEPSEGEVASDDSKGGAKSEEEDDRAVVDDHESAKPRDLGKGNDDDDSEGSQPRKHGSHDRQRGSRDGASGGAKREDEGKRRRSESGGSSSKQHHHHHHHQHKSRHRHGSHKSKDKEHKKAASPTPSSDSSGKGKDGDKKAKHDKSKRKLEEIEAKVKERCTMKSDKFKSFDMFAPKAPKPRQMPLPRTPVVQPRLPAKAAERIAPKTPDAAARRPTTPATAPAKAAKSHREKRTAPAERRKSESFVVHDQQPPPRPKVYPELPVPQTEGVDKIKQHEDDIAETKRRLELARQRKLAERQREKELKKPRKRSTSAKEAAPHEEPVKEIKRYDTPQKKRSNSTDDSDVEWHQHKSASRNRKRYRSCDSSSDDDNNGAAVNKEGLVISTRKSAQRTRAETVLMEEDGPFTSNHGFRPDEVDEHASERLASYLRTAEEDIGTVEVDPVRDEDLGRGGKDDFVYIDVSDSTDSSILGHLKPFGGNPRLVRALPEWLLLKLDQWALKRHQVEVIIEPTRVRKRRIVSEDDYDRRCGVAATKLAEPVLKKARVVLIDDIEKQLARITNESVSSETDESEAKNCDVVSELNDEGDDDGNDNPAVATPASDKSGEDEAFRGFGEVDETQPVNITTPPMSAGYTFGIECMDMYERLEDDLVLGDNKDLLEVLFSADLLTHMKKVLASDRKLMGWLSEIDKSRARAPDAFALPPSPVSCPPSDSSEKESTSPKNPSKIANAPEGTRAPRSARLRTKTN